MAADMPAPMPVEAVAAPYDWSGVYVGIHGGWAWAESDVTIPPDDIGFDTDDFVIGGQIGYNWAWDSFVFGVEGDISYTGAEDEDLVALVGVENDFLASARGRLGFAADRFLIYGTGGAAWAGFSVSDDALLEDDDTTFFGWAAGGGIEYAITDNITLGVEYLHYQFDDEDFDDFTALVDVEADLSVDVVRGRLSVKFDSLFD
jgi:outer membrane immunogenic protein